jgi:O-antigen/teichoic acid export membrane protein
VPSTVQSAKHTSKDVFVRLKGLIGAPHSVQALFFPHRIEDVIRRRSIDRYRRIALTAATSVGAKGITLLTAIVVVPLTFRYLGPERYGLWMTLTSFVLFINFADFGIGNGLTTRIAESHGREDNVEAAHLVSSAFYCLLCLSLMLFALFACASSFINWGAIYGIKSSAAIAEAGWATAVLFVCTIANMPLGVVMRVQLGFQEGFVADIWNATGSLLALAGILVAVHHGGGLPTLVLAMAGMPLLATAINSYYQFAYVRPSLRPRLRLFSLVTAGQLLSVGAIFFAQQCFGLIYYLSDNLVIAHFMGASSVARYAVLQRTFSLGVITQYMVAPLWPAISEAIARYDMKWARRTARRAIVGSIVLGLTWSIPLLVLSRWLMKHWAGFDPGPVDLLRVGFAVWVILVGYIATMNALLNQRITIRKHVCIFGAASLASLALKIFFARQGSIAGVIWATDLSFSVLYVIPTALLARNSLKDLPKEVAC